MNSYCDLRVVQSLLQQGNIYECALPDQEIPLQNRKPEINFYAALLEVSTWGLKIDACKVIYFSSSISILCCVTHQFRFLRRLIVLGRPRRMVVDLLDLWQIQVNTAYKQYAIL